MGKEAFRKAFIKVVKHYRLNPMEAVYAHHEALRSIGDYGDALWHRFVLESFLEVQHAYDKPELVTH